MRLDKLVKGLKKEERRRLRDPEFSENEGMSPPTIFDVVCARRGSIYNRHHSLSKPSSPQFVTKTNKKTAIFSRVLIFQILEDEV